MACFNVEDNPPTFSHDWKAHGKNCIFEQPEIFKKFQLNQFWHLSWQILAYSTGCVFFCPGPMCQFGTQASKAMCQMKILCAKFRMHVTTCIINFLKILAYITAFLALQSKKNLFVISLRSKIHWIQFKMKDNNGIFSPVPGFSVIKGAPLNLGAIFQI